MPASKRHPMACLQFELLREALAVCHGRPAAGLVLPRIAHLRGTLAAKRGLWDLAVAYLTIAVLIDRSGAAYSDLGEALAQSGRPADGLAAHLRALTLDSANPERYLRLGRTLIQLGRAHEAAAVYQQGLQLRTDDPDLYGHLGEACRSLRRSAEARQYYAEAIRLAPQDVDGYLRLGLTLLDERQWREACAIFEHGLTLDNELSDLHAGMARGLLGLGRYEAAVDAFRTALNLNPADAQTTQEYAMLLELSGQRGDAIGAWINVANVLVAHGRPREAIDVYQRALTRASDSLRAVLGLSRAHAIARDFEEAVRQAERAVALAPESASVHVELGRLLHVTGDIERGWSELAWQHQPLSRDWRHVEQPVWDGTSLRGRTLLLWADKELDTAEVIQFVRYAHCVATADGQVIVECDPSLAPLFEQTADEVVATGGPLPPFDVHAPLRYLPAAAPALRSMPPTRVPYLSAPAIRTTRDGRLDARRAQLASQPRLLVGLAWAGDPADRYPRGVALPLSVFARLRDLPEVCIVSLQRGWRNDERLVAPAGVTIESAHGEWMSFSDLAVLIAGLDLVITVDSVIAHLAGALGKATCTLLRRDAGWPWPQSGESTPWYPTMRLLRQERSGAADDWQTAIEAVCVVIKTHAATRPYERHAGSFAPR